ncbi:cholecystokinin receptor type A-like [Patiria miniata]|uniref:G-protein coupled receptors family 1 profile domain-containing protein n=1 Tax=Patiria miniata TaxID=46514 RepID=A0A914BBW3_PATMI|nr:cholecystokinin receptor type A-like [Patiria miniata]
METETAVGYSLQNLSYNASMNGTEEGPTMTPVQRLVLWVVLDGIIGFLGVTGNGLVLLVFFRGKSSRNLINLFIINQSMIDFTSSLVFLLIHLGPKFELEPGNTGHLILCKIWVSEYVMWALFISSSINLICITLERYVATLKPAWYRKKVAAVKRRIVPVAAAVWGLGFLIDAFWAYVQHVLPGNLCVPIYKSKVWQGVGGVLIFCVTYLIPLTCMAFCYSQIIRKLHQQAAKVQSQSPARTLSRVVNANEQASGTGTNGNLLVGSRKTARSTVKSQAMKNVIKTMMIVSATYAISWAPIAFNYVIYNLGGPLDFTSTWYEVTKIFAYANMCGNPFIYAMQYRQFQVGLKRMFCCRKLQQTRVGAQPTEMSVSGGDTLA